MVVINMIPETDIIHFFLKLFLTFVLQGKIKIGLHA